MGDNEDSRGDRDKKAQNQDESTLGKKSKTDWLHMLDRRKEKAKETRLPRIYVKKEFFLHLPAAGVSHQS